MQHSFDSYTTDMNFIRRFRSRKVGCGYLRVMSDLLRELYHVELCASTRSLLEVRGNVLQNTAPHNTKQHAHIHTILQGGNENLFRYIRFCIMYRHVCF